VGIPLGRLLAISHPHEGVTFNPDGSLSYRDATTEEFTQRTKAVHKEVANGTFKPNRVNDQLTQALGNKEHPSPTRGFVHEENAQTTEVTTYDGGCSIRNERKH
jgi:hypothetical protein